MIANLRKKIDGIDLEIQKLLKKRIEIAKKIGEIKKESNLAIANLNRENDILEKLKKAWNDDKTFYLYEKIIKDIFKLSKEVQKWKN